MNFNGIGRRPAGAWRVAAVAWLLAASVAAAQDVTYDYDRTADFAAFKTYAWIPGTPVGDRLNDERIVRAIDAELAERGLRRVARGADLLVAYHASFERDLQITGFSSGWGGYRLGGMRSGSARADRITVGTLTVDLIVAETRTIVWRGRASKDVDADARPAAREKHIVRAARKMFAHYPPPAR